MEIFKGVTHLLINIKSTVVVVDYGLLFHNKSHFIILVSSGNIIIYAQYKTEAAMSHYFYE